MAPALDHLSLLSDVIPAFLDLAAFFTSKHEIAIAARNELSPKDSFYTKFYDELSILSDILSALGEAVCVPASIPMQVLDVLKTRFLSKAQVRIRVLCSMLLDHCAHLESESHDVQKYPRLRNLQEQLNRARDRNSCLNTNNLRKLVRIKEGKPKVRRTMIERVAGCSKDLKESTQRWNLLQKRVVDI